MAIYQRKCPSLKQWPVLKFLIAKKSKLPEMFRRIYDANRETRFNLKKFTDGLNKGLLP